MGNNSPVADPVSLSVLPNREYPRVSVILPSLNAEDFIAQCLDSLVLNDYPRDRLEVLCIDGMSTDRTRQIIRSYSERHAWIRLVDNPNKIIPTGLNIGLHEAKGEVILRVIAHSVYERRYISQCVDCLERYDADIVGGVWIIVPREQTWVGRAIAMALSHPFGAGNGYYKSGVVREPRLVDVVGIGCWKRGLSERIGSFNENLARSEDVEFNARVRRAGGRILLVPSISSHYFARARLGEFARHNCVNGFWITYPLKFVRSPFSWRHWAPLIFVATVMGLAIIGAAAPAFLSGFLLVLGMYASMSIVCSVYLAIRETNVRYVFILPVVFFLLHVPYGLGSMWGLLRVIPDGQFWLRRFTRK